MRGVSEGKLDRLGVPKAPRMAESGVDRCVEGPSSRSLPQSLSALVTRPHPRRPPTDTHRRGCGFRFIEGPQPGRAGPHSSFSSPWVST